MTKQTARYIPIEQVVNYYIDEAHLTDAHFLRLWGIAIRGLEEMSYSFAADPISRKLNVNPNKTVNLPGDYVMWCKVGVVNERGEIATLKINPNLSRYAATDDDRVDENAAVYQTEDYGKYYRNYNYDGTYVHLYGAEGGADVIGECNVLEDDGVIILNPDYQYDHVILEYTASPIANGDYLMPVLIREALISWLRWKDRQSLPAGRRSNATQRAMDKRDYFGDLKRGKRLMKRFRLSEANDIIRLNNRLALKA